MPGFTTILLVGVGAVIAVVVVVLGRRDAAAVRERADAHAAQVRADASDMLAETRQARADFTTERDQDRARLGELEARLVERDAALTRRTAELDADARAAEKSLDDLRGHERRLSDRESALGAAEADILARRAQLEAEESDGRREREAATEQHQRRLDAELADQRRRLDAETEVTRQALAADERVARQRQAAELSRIASLTAEDARAELVAAEVEAAKRQALSTVRIIEDEARQTGEYTARRIVSDAVQRVAAEQTTESVVSLVHLPSDDLKGRIIGREGRNIRAFEAITGVNLVIDDTPGAVLLSCFDPVRRERARVTLESLVADGRIHPQRIEQVHEQASAEVEHLIARAGARALEETGVVGLHPDLVHLLGTLRYRTSYGQNVLGHLIETAHIAGNLAAEFGLHVPTVKRCAFLHDIGKALTHEVEGTHAMIGADLARKYGEHEDVVHAIAAHHNEIQPQTVEAVLTQASDACSGGRPGARREALESYVERLERMEAIAVAHAGVDKVFAMSAGRELRVLVQPEVVGDGDADLMARDIAAQIADELTYPGQIRVTVVRESRASALAS